MAYEDLKKTILDNYGGQDNVPDSVYNALYKFKQNGQDALDDRDYAILSEAKNYKLPEVTEPSTMEFAAFAHPTTPFMAVGPNADPILDAIIPCPNLDARTSSPSPGKRIAAFNGSERSPVTPSPCLAPSIFSNDL